MERLECATIIPGWTLRPENNWYEAAADYITDSTGVPVNIAAMPNPDNPDPTEWTKMLERLIVTPEKHLIIAHGLGFIATINWAAAQARKNLDFKLGGLISVAGNINAVGFSEIAPHFDHPEQVEHAEGVQLHDNSDPEETKRLLEFGDKMELMRLALQYRPVAIHGKHDPFVPFEHAYVIRELLDGNMIVDESQAHFSGLYMPEEGEPIPSTGDIHVGKAYICARNRTQLYSQMPWYSIGLTAVDIIRASHYLHGQEQAGFAAGTATTVSDSINRITVTIPR